MKRSITHMNLNTLQRFRHEVYGCFDRAADALFNTVDALLTETQAQSFPELSLSPWFERRWGSLYEAFEDGQIDQGRVRRVFARYLMQPSEGERAWLGIDATSIQGPESKTARDRTVVYVHNPPKDSKPTGKPGAPRKDGERFQCGNPSTYGQASGSWQGTDANGQAVEVTWWTGLHLPKARHLEVTVIRVVRHQATDRPRDPRESWFLWDGATNACVPEVALGYRRRYSHEHGYRFDKQNVLWTQPRLRTPEQFERWSQIVAIVHNHLLLARPEVQAELRPWETSQRPASPQQVRRALAKIVAQLGTPAQPPKPRGKSPGRQKGAVLRPAPRYPVVYKSKPGSKKRRKRA